MFSQGADYLMDMHIPLTQGYSACIDAEDYPLIAQFDWYAHKSNACVYARTRAKGHELANGSGVLTMHRLLVPDWKQGQTIDHINRNSLDNRKCNLRIASVSENNRNRSNARPNTGVYAVNGKFNVVLNCGRFESESEAIEIANKVRAFLESLKE